MKPKKASVSDEDVTDLLKSGAKGILYNQVSIEGLESMVDKYLS